MLYLNYSVREQCRLPLDYAVTCQETHVAFVGDSYIVRFEAAIGVHLDIHQDLKLSDCRASFVARRGAKVETISHMLPTICMLHPYVLFLQIGGNIISYETQNGVHISTKIETLINDILTRTSCQLVYIGELLFRYKGKYIPSTEVADHYNAQVHAANCALKSYCQKECGELVKQFSSYPTFYRCVDHGCS